MLVFPDLLRPPLCVPCRRLYPRFVSPAHVFVDDESGQLGARYWYNGVNPGGVAGSGDTRQEAERDFFDAIGLTLQELTSESGSQEEFRDLVKAFVEDVNRPELQDWLKLRQEVRAGAVTASDLAPERAARAGPRR